MIAKGPVVAFNDGLKMLGLARRTFFRNRTQYDKAIFRKSPRRIVWKLVELERLVAKGTGAL